MWFCLYSREWFVSVQESGFVSPILESGFVSTIQEWYL